MNHSCIGLLPQNGCCSPVQQNTARKQREQQQQRFSHDGIANMRKACHLMTNYTRCHVTPRPPRIIHRPMAQTGLLDCIPSNQLINVVALPNADSSQNEGKQERSPFEETEVHTNACGTQLMSPCIATKPYPQLLRRQQQKQHDTHY